MWTDLLAGERCVLAKEHKTAASGAQPMDLIVNSGNLGEISMGGTTFRAQPPVVQHSFPVSWNQQRLWILEQLYPGNSAYHIAVCLRLTGSLGLEFLERSLQAVVARHGSLRTTFSLQGDVLVQCVSPILRVPLRIQDVSRASREDPEAQAAGLARAEVQKPFDLSIGPLIRMMLIRLGELDHILVGTMHHIISDGQSAELLVQELAEHYAAFSANVRPNLQPLSMQYSDFALLQRHLMAAPHIEQQLSFWKRTLAGAPVLHDFPCDRPRPEKLSFAGASQALPLDLDLVIGLQRLAKEHQATFFMILAAAFQVLLWSYGNQKDVLVGIPVSGRTIVETEGLIGLFVNTIVLRTTLSGNARFLEVLNQVRDSMLDALTNQEVPFELVVDAVQARRSLSHNPIFQIMFSTFRAAVQSRKFGHLNAAPYIVESRAARFDLCVNIIEGVDGAWWAQAEYSTELFNGTRISRMLEAYIHLLRATHADGHKRLSDLCLVLHGHAHGRPSRLDNVSGPTVPSPQNRRGIPIRADPNPASADGSPDSIAHGEQKLIPIWEKYLETSPIPVDADFFGLGGNSLLAIRLVAAVNQTFRKRLAVSTLFRDCTIHKMAKRLCEQTTFRSSFFPIASGGHKTPLFAGGSQRYFKDLSRALGSDQPFFQMDIYALLEERLLAGESLLIAIEDVATHFLQEMLSIQPFGPYLLAGQCEGGILVLEIARQLQSRGRDVAALFQFDTPVSGYLGVPSWRQRLVETIRRRQFLLKVSKFSVALIKRQLPAGKAPVTEQHLWSVIWKAIRQYKSDTMVGSPITLFRATELPLVRNDVADGWHQIGNVEIIDVPGDHASLFLHPEAQSTISRAVELAHQRMQADKGLSV
jgi:thioesterase domain-containing protein/NRPS condensation-like uncharacterized protein